MYMTGPRDEDIEIEEGLQDYEDEVEDEAAEAWEDFDRFSEQADMDDMEEENSKGSGELVDIPETAYKAHWVYLKEK